MIFYVLVLEDSKERIKQFRDRFNEADVKIVPDYTDDAQECIEKIKTKKYDIVFLDHDLGDEVFVSSDREDCGSAVARWINENPNNLNKDTAFVIHSFNPNGADNMNRLIPGSVKISSVWTKPVFSQINFNH